MEDLALINKKFLEESYAGKNVFITGHTGFKGSWLVTCLHLLNANIKGYALAPENKFDLYNEINGNQLCTSVIADIRDKDRLEEEILHFQPDYIFHLAAQPLVRLSYELPIDTFETNVMGTVNLLNAVRKLEKPSQVICITTDKVYENMEWHYPYRENDRLGGHDPYSASKAAAELVISSYRSSFFNPDTYDNHKKSIASARAGNVIGGGDWAEDRIIPDIIRALQNREEIKVRNPFSIRPWQHVLEPLYGYIILGAHMHENPNKYASAWNFGPMADDNKTVQQLVEIAIEVWGSGSYEVSKAVNQVHEAGLLKLDINKAINELQWSPKWNARKAIEMTIEFYKNTNEKALFNLINQIQEYGI